MFGGALAAVPLVRALQPICGALRRVHRHAGKDGAVAPLVPAEQAHDFHRDCKMAKKLVNGVGDVVEEMVQGALLVNPALRRTSTEHHVLVRSDIAVHRAVKVTLISGGGSGHEPAHAGYIGAGMLSGAVLGGVFASPGVAAILEAIRTCAGAPGVLLVRGAAAVRRARGGEEGGAPTPRADRQELQRRPPQLWAGAAARQGRGVAG